MTLVKVILVVAAFRVVEELLAANGADWKSVLPRKRPTMTESAS